MEPPAKIDIKNGVVDTSDDIAQWQDSKNHQGGGANIGMGKVVHGGELDGNDNTKFRPHEDCTQAGQKEG